MGETLLYQTHFEIESLPTSSGIWGYLHYPVMARQARTYGVDFLGMTGRFHKAWADFGGLKTRDQLDYECGTIVAAGGGISVGDQLHPRGVLDPAVYRLLEHSFGRVERLEPFLKGAKPTAEVAILSGYEPSSLGSIPTNTHVVADVEGAAQLFLEAAIQFDIIDPVAYQPRRTTQPVQHVDQSWPTSGLSVEVLTDGRTIGKVHLAPENEPLDFEVVDGYARIALPPVGAHTVIVVE
jgi:hypothetical protein